MIESIRTSARPVPESNLSKLGEDIEIPAADGSTSLPAYAALPSGATRGMVVIHEIFGRQPEIDRVVDRFARAGYAAVSPDLFATGSRIRCIVRAVRAIRLTVTDELNQTASATPVPFTLTVPPI